LNNFEILIDKQFQAESTLRNLLVTVYFKKLSFLILTKRIQADTKRDKRPLERFIYCIGYLPVIQYDKLFYFIFIDKFFIYHATLGTFLSL